MGKSLYTLRWYLKNTHFKNTNDTGEDSECIHLFWELSYKSTHIRFISGPREPALTNHQPETKCLPGFVYTINAWFICAMCWLECVVVLKQKLKVEGGGGRGAGRAIRIRNYHLCVSLLLPMNRRDLSRVFVMLVGFHFKVRSQTGVI